MVEPSLPLSRVRAAAVPDWNFYRGRRLFWIPCAYSVVPHSPVSGNISSTLGLPLAGPGIGSTSRLGGRSLKILFMASGWRDPEAHAATSPSSILHTVLLCILVVHNPRWVVVSRGSRWHTGLCFSALSQSLYLSPSQLPRRNAIASDARCHHSGWPASFRQEATGSGPSYLPPWTGLGVREVTICPTH